MAQSQRGATPRHVVIAGASFAGLGAAYTLRKRLRADDRVTVITPNDSFVFAPSLVWAALGRTNASSRFALEPALRRKNIDFIQSGVREVDAAAHTLRTDSDQVSYDRLVIATGGRPDTSAIPGLAGEFRAASWVVNENSAMEARNVLRQLFNEPGPLVIGASQGASYISAAYELALSLDAALRREGLRDRVPITFVTAEPFLGHLGFGQTAARDKLQKIFSQRNIQTRMGVEIEQVQADGVRLSNLETVLANAIIVMPPLTGAVEIWKSSGLTDETGMIKVTPQYRHVEHPDIYASGVASYFSEPIPPLGYAHPPHTGYLSLRTGIAAGENVAASLDCGKAPDRALPRRIDVRVLDGGTVGMVLTSQGYEALHNRAMVLPGWAGHRLKSAIERYLVWQLRTGRMPSI